MIRSGVSSRIIDADSFEDCFLTWTRAVFSPPNKAAPRQIAVDGKAMRRSFDRRSQRSALHVVSAFATHSGLTLAQRVVADKSGEAEMLMPLLEGLDLAGALISLDALYARKSLLDRIAEKGADYLVALKKNNKHDYLRVEAHFAMTSFGKGADYRPVLDAFDETHGRLTRRRAFVTQNPQLIEALEGWR
ncbi:ISAs1 family transposase, partial [Roseibium sp. RKSG952]|uniref:ISAs1 family transposase n=1 Tax=Roseibium sp. RKSG952 TaxID=2529384 RepID=UPI0012BCABD2